MDQADGSPVGGLPPTVRNHLGLRLRAAFAASMEPGMPQRLLDLIAQLDQALSARDRDSADTFRLGLIDALPKLRLFAMSIIPDAHRVDDLVQETVLKAWAKQDLFVPGTNLTAWLCTILRNHFYTEYRKRKREVEDADGAAAAELISPASQEHTSELRAVWAHIAKLPAAQREALLLVGAQGLTYEAAAEVMGCETGTVKSRVSRARASLVESLV
ncbi:NepR family anti-sigma factor [Methylobacterium sp. NMS12]|uniref:NepR family anti-sigma factor n=1 Tax=Methylobacterium sp. NMS12 TaxID=3079766 RepID=UPI003F880384